MVKPALHVGVQLDPLAKEAVHGLRMPFVGALSVHGSARLHLAVSVSVPAWHDLDPVAM